jgi:hypothetical protein
MSGGELETHGEGGIAVRVSGRPSEDLASAEPRVVLVPRPRDLGRMQAGEAIHDGACVAPTVSGKNLASHVPSAF